MINKDRGTGRTQSWVGLDLHVHTPASDDYQGPRERSEYLKIIKAANEFEGAERLSSGRKGQGKRRPISCLAFTDHNSLEGFKEWRKLYDETVSLAEAVRDRDPNNALLQQLDKDLNTLRSVRILMGLELNAYPGVHLLVIFHESIKPDAAEKFLEEAYQKPYLEVAGKPGLMTAISIEETLDKTATTFGDHAMVIAPHIESGGGLYAVLREHLHQVLMPVLRHDALQALSFNKPETRDRIKELLTQPQYHRNRPIALIQSSDAHGSRGSVGQPRTEIKIAGQPTFTAIREAFCAQRLKCSVDFVTEEYDRLTGGQLVKKFVADSGTSCIRTEDRDELAKFVCAALNSHRGIVQLDLTINANEELSHYYPEPARQQFEKSIEQVLDPPHAPIFTRALPFSATRVCILFKPVSFNRLYTVGATVYITDDGNVRPARAVEIETIVAELIESRFGERFQKTLQRVSSESVLLSKVPQGIPLFLRTRQRLAFYSAKELNLTKIENTAGRGRDIAEEAQHLYTDKLDETPFGISKGNTSFINQLDIRFKEHYTRYHCFRTDLSGEETKRLAGPKLEKTSIIVTSGGAALLCEPGFVVANAPAVRIELPEILQSHTYACLGRLKSSFLIWYCGVHLSEKDLYQQLQKHDIRLPFPDPANEEFYRRLGALVRNAVIEEKRFLDEVQKQMSRGADARMREKLRTRHNATMSGICLTIDDEVNKALGLRPDEVEIVAGSIIDIGLTDFGMLERIESERKTYEQEEDN